MLRNRQTLWNLGALNRVHALAILAVSLLAANMLHATVLPIGLSWLIGAALFAVLVVLSRLSARPERRC